MTQSPCNKQVQRAQTTPLLHGAAVDLGLSAGRYGQWGQAIAEGMKRPRTTALAICCARLHQHEGWTALSTLCQDTNRRFRALHTHGAAGETISYSAYDMHSEPAASVAISAMRLKDLLLRVASRRA